MNAPNPNIESSRKGFRRILLCTHGTPGAERAEQYVFDKFAPLQALVESITVLRVIDSGWKWMTGDDWLNASATRMTFAGYVESQIQEEIERHKKKLNAIYGLSSKANFIQKVGEIEEVIARTAEEENCDLVIIGAHQKKQAPGFKSRINFDKLLKLLPCPIVIVP